MLQLSWVSQAEDNLSLYLSSNGQLISIEVTYVLLSSRNQRIVTCWHQRLAPQTVHSFQRTSHSIRASHVRRRGHWLDFTDVFVSSKVIHSYLAALLSTMCFMAFDQSSRNIWSWGQRQDSKKFSYIGGWDVSEAAEPFCQDLCSYCRKVEHLCSEILSGSRNLSIIIHSAFLSIGSMNMR